MNKTLERDIVEASDATEHLLKRLPDMPLDEQVDVAARLRAVTKNIDVINDTIKGNIKKKLKNKPGTILGDVFKAALSLVPTTRFNQSAFKEAHIDLYEKWCETKDQERITFEAR